MPWQAQITTKKLQFQCKIILFHECHKSTSCLLSSFAVQTFQSFASIQLWMKKVLLRQQWDVYIEEKLKIYEHAIKLNFVCCCFLECSLHCWLLNVALYKMSSRKKEIFRWNRDDVVRHKLEKNSSLSRHYYH